MLAAVRSTDIVGRLGGDEFGVLITGYDSPQELDAILDRIVASIREPFTTAERASRVQASIGVAIYPTNAMDGNNLLRAAGC